MFIRKTAMIALALAAIPGIAAAHHSTAVDFDKDTVAAIEGVVTRINFVNPHVRFYVWVKPPGQFVSRPVGQPFSRSAPADSS